MNESMTTTTTVLAGAVVEEEIHLTLVELCRVCHVGEEEILLWVDEGVLRPAGTAPPEWRFSGQALRRTRVASRLARDLALNPPGVALALDLLDEIEQLRSQLQRLARDEGR